MAIQSELSVRSKDKTSDKSPEQEQTILYDILIFTEWPQEPEYLGKASFEKGDNRPGGSLKGSSLLYGAAAFPVGFLGSWFSSFYASPTVPASYVKFVNSQMPWHMTMGGEGKLLAILQETVAEIRSSRDDFGSVIGKCSVPKDPEPEWRRVCFSPDCSMLAVASSRGQVAFFDLLGNSLFTIAGDSGDVSDVTSAVAGMVFVDCRIKSTQQWSSEFLVLTCAGTLSSYLVSPTDGFRENHSFSLRSAYPRGVCGLAHHPSHQLLFVCGWAEPLPDPGGGQTPATGRDYGLTAWRMLSDYPHYKVVTTLHEDQFQPKKSFLQRISKIRSSSSTNEENYVLRMSVSPSGRLLSAVHSSGCLSVWHLPSLRLQRLWDLEQQPFKVPSRFLHDLPAPRRKAGLDASIVCDLNWWSDQAMILARLSGAVTVTSVKDLENLLGQSAEPFEPSPQVSAARDRKFLVLESECVVTSKGRSGSQSGKTDDDMSSSDDEDVERHSLIGQGMQALRSALYYMTDSERFQPPRKRAKIVTRNFRLLCLKSTTPEELFARKLDNEEYGEALALAKLYCLDCDLVYQRQWRKTPVSVISIQDYLSKISKRSWVIHECLERVPQYLEATRRLLLYGLQKTDLDVLAQMQSCEEDTYEDIAGKKSVEQRKIDFKNLTMEQKQTCQSRLKLLTYLDRLDTYEIILGGGSTASELYDFTFFGRFRKQSGLEAAVMLARDGNSLAVADMLTYHGAETLVHWLPILSNFPETMSPLDYRALLPEAGFRPDEPEVYSWDEIKLREMDWCETNYSGSAATPEGENFSYEFYEENKDLLKYRQEVLSPDLLTDWYLQRARQIESGCGAVDNALDLIKYGRERNVKGLEQLQCQLQTLESLVYECQFPISLEMLEASRDEEKIKMLMQGSTTENFVQHCRRRLLPFLDRLESMGEDPFPLLVHYFVDVAGQQLHLCQLFLQASRPDVPEPLLPSLEQLIALALECIYACQREDQLTNCCSILECLPERGSGDWSEVIERYHKEADELEKHLMVCRVLEEYGCPVTPACVRSSQNDPSEVKKLYFSLANSATSKQPVLTDCQWKDVLHKMLDMQSTLFNCIQPEDCYEVLVNCLLCSSKKELITLSGSLMQVHPKRNSGRLPYPRSLTLILLAAEKYFNLASEAADPSIALARSCLNLVPDRPPEVERELDLIHSLSLLKEFSLTLIPLQVRLCKDRLDIIKQVLRSKAQAYGNIQKLLRLSTLLRVCGEDREEREGQVITLVAEAALEEGDYLSSFQACQQLMERHYVQGWTVCKRLATCSQFQDIKGRIQLLLFSIAYCSSDLIETLLRSKQELELLELNDLVNCALTELREDEELPGERSLVRQTKDISLQVLQTTHQTTRKVLASVGNSLLWKDAIKWIRKPRYTRDGDIGGGFDYESDGNNNNSDLRKIGLPAFYLGTEVHNNVHISQMSSCYNCYLLPDLPGDLKTQLQILQATLIDDSLNSNNGSTSLDSQILVELCRQTMSEDTALALAFLYPILNPTETAEVLSTLPRTAVMLEVAAYFFCLCMLTNGKRGTETFTRGHLYRKNPTHVMKMGEEIVHDGSPQVDQGESWTSLFLSYQVLLSQRTQADLLGSLHQRLGPQEDGRNPFDIDTFLADDAYKETVILGLASSPKDVFVVVRSLADQYNIPLWELLFRRLRALLNSSNNTSVSELESEITTHKMCEILGERPVELSQRMSEQVLPLMDGRDLPHLSHAHRLLETCGDLANPTTGLHPSQELRLIRKLIPSCPGINYFDLMTPAKSEEIILKALTSSNVQIFVKNADMIPKLDGSRHDASSVYRLYAQKHFFELGGRKEPSSFMDWVHRYEGCSETASKLSAADFLDFVNRITFNETAVTKIPSESRLEINRRALKYSKHREHANEGQSDWHTTSESLKGNLEHLRKMEDQLLLDLRTKRKDYAIKMDMTRSQPDLMESLVVEAVLDGLDMGCLQTLLALTPVQMGMDPSQAFSTTIQILAQHLSNPEYFPHPYLEGKDPLALLQDIMAVLAQDDCLLSECHQVELLSPLLSDSSAPATYRMAVADLLEKDLDLSEESKELVVRCRTQCLVGGEWPQVDMTQVTVDTASDRLLLFERLLPMSETREQLEALARMALSWPHSDTTEEAWVNLFLHLIPASTCSQSQDVALATFQLVLSHKVFSSQNLESLFESFCSEGSLEHIVHFAVLSEQQCLMDRAHTLLQKKGTAFDSSAKLLDLLLERHLVAWSVGTPLFGPLSRRLLSKSPDAVPSLVEELERLGFCVEAGALLSHHQGLHPSLATFSNALTVLRDWMTQK